MRNALEVRPPLELRIRGWENTALLLAFKQLDAGTLSIDMRETGKCLGSHVAQLGNRSPFVYMGMVFSYSLRELYFPGIKPNGEIDYRHPAWGASSKQVAQAIANFLTTGDPMWSKVMLTRA